MDGHDTPPDASRRGMAEDVRRGLLAGLAILALVMVFPDGLAGAAARLRGRRA